MILYVNDAGKGRRIPTCWYICEDYVSALKSWVANHDGEIPRRDAKDPETRRLGKFLSHQQQALRFGERAHCGELTVERRQLLLQVPGMMDLIKRWESMDGQKGIEMLIETHVIQVCPCNGILSIVDPCDFLHSFIAPKTPKRPFLGKRDVLVLRKKKAPARNAQG